MSDAVSPVQLDGTQWVLTSMSGSAPVAGSSITLNLAQGNVSGSAGCNQYRGPYTANGSSLAFGAIAATKRACAEDDRNAQETAYLDALSRVKSFQVTGDRLLLMDAGGVTLLEYSRSAAQAVARHRGRSNGELTCSLSWPCYDFPDDARDS